MAGSGLNAFASLPKGGGSCAELPLFVLEAFGRLLALLSALRAGVLSFASPKESSQRKGDPMVGAPSGFLPLLGEPGGLPELACGSNKASRIPPARLRCSAPLKGVRKASRDRAPSEKLSAAVTQQNCQKANPSAESGRFTGPLERCRATQGLAEKGRGLSEGQRPEFRSPRQSRVAQGTRAAGTDPGSPSSLATFFLATQEESTPAPQARKPTLEVRRKQTPQQSTKP